MTSTDPAAQSAVWSPFPPAPGSWAVTRNGAGDPVSLAFKLNTATNGITNGPTQCAIKVAAGYLASLFLKSDGSVWSMGDNRYGQLGDGTHTSTDKPGFVASGVTMIAEGLWDGLMVKNDGSLWGWGYTYFDELGPIGPLPIYSPTLLVTNGVTAIAEGGYHTLFLKSDGSLWGMGDNTYGQLGLFGVPQATHPTPIATGVTAISAGLHHSLFLKSDGSLWAMGDNAYGQLGAGTSANVNPPQPIVTNGVTAISAGEYHSLFLKNDGSLWAMGYNGYGQLGIAASANVNQPMPVPDISPLAISAGAYHSLFLMNNGSLWGAGKNSDGQLGDGTTITPPLPKQVVGSGVTAISAGHDYSLFIKSDHSLWGMGRNGAGQLGDGTTLNVSQPTPIAADCQTTPVTNVCAGSLYALSQDNTGFSTINTISPSGATTPLFGVGAGFDALCYAAPDLGYGPDLFYAISKDATGFSTLKSVSLNGATLARFGIGSGFNAVTFAAADLGYGPSLFYAIATDANNSSTLYTISTSGAIVARFGLGSGFKTLTFAAPDLGYGPNLFYALSTDANNASTLYTISTSGAIVARFGVGSGSQGIAFAPDDLGYGPNLLYAISTDNNGLSTLSTISTSGAIVARFGLGNGFGPLAYRPAQFSFQAPSDMVLIGPGGTVNFPTPVAINNCCGTNITVTCTPPSGSVFPPGETTVVCQAADCEGHTNTVTFKVDVIPQVIAPALSGNYTYNGSFESANYPGNVDISYTDPGFSLPGWTWSATASSQILLEYGQPLGSVRFADGQAAVCLRGQGTPVSISQTFQTTPGANYILRFAQSDENNSGPSCSELTVSVAGRSRRFSLTNDSGNHLWDDHGYRLQAMQFTAQSNWTTLTFTDTSAAGCPSPFLDSVCVNAGGAPLAGFTTPIPSHASSFTNFPGAPFLGGDSAVFKGSGADDPDSIVCGNGILFPFPTNPRPPLTLVADTTKAIPGGIGTFLGFGSPALSSFSGGFSTAFVGSGSGGQQGIYWRANSGGLSFGPLGRIADTTTAISSGHGNFTAFIPNGGYAGLSPSLSGSTLVFWGAGADYEGILRCATPITPTNPPPHSPIADTTTPIPGGLGNFRTFVNQRVPPPPNPGPWKELGVSGGTVAFWAAGSGSQEGIYAASLNAAGPVSQPWPVADTSTPITNGVGNFIGFLGLDIATGPSGVSHIAFVGLGAGGQQGVYAEDDDPTRLIQPGPHPPKFVADTNTFIPGGLGSFTAFTSVACGGDAGVSIAFAATGLNGQKGIYAVPAPGASGASPFPLTKIVDLNDTLDGKALLDLQLGAGALAGNWLAFKAVFVDGTKGLYTIPVIDNLFITSVVRNGSDLQLSVTAPVGYTFGLRSAADLTIPAWGPEPGGTFPGNGGVLNFTNGPGPLKQKYLRAYKAAYPP
jgi:alpha-tubulin suppressor-like RCC1 family protein